MCSKNNEIDNDLIMKAIAQAIANVSLEVDYTKKIEEKKIKEKVLGGSKNNGKLGRLHYRGY